MESYPDPGVIDRITLLPVHV